MRRFRLPLLLALVAAFAPVLLLLRVRGSVVTPATRGEEIARRAGCFACHGGGGAGGGPNPGAAAVIPGFTPASAKAFIRDDAELEEWVLDGMPRRLKGVPRDDDALLAMPAYRGRLSPGQWRDLRAWLRAMHGLDAPPETDAAEPEAAKARAGWSAAQGAGCFGCHGPSGRGLRRNPGSLAGAIPGWDSPAFADLVKSDAELEEWIRTGKSARLERNPVARHFLHRQLIQMPPYDGALEDERIAAIVAYIKWMRKSPAT